MHTTSSCHNIDIVPGKVKFSVLKSLPRNSASELFFTIENEPIFQYKPFFKDFGPPSLLQIYTFISMVEEYMSTNTQVLHFFCSPLQDSKSNSALFISAFRMIHLNLNADDAFKPLHSLAMQLKPFRDASTLQSTFDLTVLDCLRGLHKAISLNWFNMVSFDPESWASNESVENGDMNWLIPGKLLAFASPYNEGVLPGGYKVATPETLIPTFKKLGITHIIRLNKPFYDAEVFKAAGFKHTEMYFLDGSVPSSQIVDKFLSITETEDVIALHCKAGLGRTGTLAGCYLIKHYGFSAREAIGWIRLCRPGSIIGPQQHFLQDYDAALQRPKTEIPTSQRRVKPPERARFITATRNGTAISNPRNQFHRIKSPPKNPIMKPFSDEKNFIVRATPINSFHPQPRKIGQKNPIGKSIGV